MIVRLRKRVRKPLTAGQLYPVIGIEADWYRIINDDGKPYLYDPKLFQTIDPREPSDWISDVGQDGERYAYPKPLNRAGFFEDYHDGDQRTVAIFWNVVNRWLADAG